MCLRTFVPNQITVKLPYLSFFIKNEVPCTFHNSNTFLTYISLLNEHHTQKRVQTTDKYSLHIIMKESISKK